MATPTIGSYSIVDYLVSLGWNYVLTNRDSQRYLGPCPVGNHENDDTNPRFSIHANGIAFSCFKCGFQGGGLRDLKEKMGHGAEPRVPMQPIKPVAKALEVKPVKRAPNNWQGATVKQLCEAKGIDYEYATRTLGWKDTIYGGKHSPAVAMPYYDTDGQIADTRYRVGISDGTRVVSRKGSHVMPYGLQNLAQYRAGNYIILQEGETDWATLDAMGYNALGIPGVMSFKPEWTVHLNGIKTVYIWQESGGKPDLHGRTPGQQMVHRISMYRGEVFVLEAPPEGKDPCELHQKLGDEAFMALLDQMMLDAKPYNAVTQESSQNRRREALHDSNHVNHTHKPVPAPIQPVSAPQPAYTIGNAFDIGYGCKGKHYKANRVSQSIDKPVNITTLFFGHREEYLVQNPKIEEFYGLSQVGVKLCDFCIFLDDPRQLASQSQMENIVSGALGQIDLSNNPVPAYLAIVDCGRGMTMTCDQHGPQYGGSHKCYQGWCPNCVTQAASEVSKLKMPNLVDVANYYHVVFETIDELPENADHWGPIFSRQIEAWQRVMAKASGWKESKGKIYSRSHATYYGLHHGKRAARTSWKVMFHEISEGSLAKTVERIASAMNATVIDERRWSDGQTATLQIVSDFTTHFIGIDPSFTITDQNKIFLAHYNSTRSRHIFQAYGLLRKMINELPEPEPQICPVVGCGLRLREVLVPKAPLEISHDMRGAKYRSG